MEWFLLVEIYCISHFNFDEKKFFPPSEKDYHLKLHLHGPVIRSHIEPDFISFRQA